MISSFGLFAFVGIGRDFITELPNGTIQITDSLPPAVAPRYFELDGTPPKLKHVNDRNFPNL